MPQPDPSPPSQAARVNKRGRVNTTSPYDGSDTGDGGSPRCGSQADRQPDVEELPR